MEKEYCTLDDRTVIIPDSYKEIGVEYDDSVNRIWFRFPKIVGDNADLSAMRIQINYHNAFGEADIYSVDDAVEDGEYIIFSWLLDDKVTKYRGNIGFVVRAGSEDRKWNTALCKKCTVLKGLDCSKQIEKQNPEIIEYILAKLDAAITISPEDIAVAVEGYMKENPITANDIGADPEGTAESKISEHNTAPDAHNDIRLLVQRLTERLSALADSDDTTLDQMSEIVAYIKSNKSLIDAITTGKVSVSDIVDNLVTNVSNKPLSAAQGVALKALIDGITTVELDESLTDNTKAAPAGMVGELKEDLGELEEEIYNSQIIDDGWEIGTYDTTWGTKYDGLTTRARIENIQNKCVSLIIKEPYNLVAFGYNASGTYVGIWNGSEFAESATVLPSGKYDIKGIIDKFPNYSINISIGKSVEITDISMIYENVLFRTSKITQIEKNKEDIVELRKHTTNVISLSANHNGSFLITDDTVINGNGYCIDCGEHIEAITTQTADVYAKSYVANTESRMHKVFIAKSLPIKVDSSSLSIGYNSTLWANYEDETKDYKLEPVLTYNEMLSKDKSWYYDGSMIWIHNSDSTTKYTIADFEEYGVYVEGCNFEISNVTIMYAWKENFRCVNANGKCCNVKFKYTSTSSGALVRTRSNVIFDNCVSFKARFDGFGIDGNDTNTTFIGCRGMYNYDDGISHHDKCRYSIIGGEYHHNNKGGVSPCYGSVGIVSDVYTHDNGYGIYAVAESKVDEPLIISNCIMQNNEKNNIIGRYYDFVCKNNTYGEAGWPNDVLNGTIVNY